MAKDFMEGFFGPALEALRKERSAEFWDLGFGLWTSVGMRKTGIEA
jgi:hypothetical protein